MEAYEYQTKTSTLTGGGGNVALVASLRQSLNVALQQNGALRSRLQKIHMDSDVADLPIVASTVSDTLPRCSGGMNNSMSYSSSCISEFFDAREYNTDGEEDTTDDEDGEEVDDEDDFPGAETGGSEESDDDEVSADCVLVDLVDQLFHPSHAARSIREGAAPKRQGQIVSFISPFWSSISTNEWSYVDVRGAERHRAGWEGQQRKGEGPGVDVSSCFSGGFQTRQDDWTQTGEKEERSTLFHLLTSLSCWQKLPVVKAETEGINLWNLLTKNIGKDLSKISMPVTLNEPLSALQRLCEELEYSELLDKASSPGLSDLERMTWVAAFSVSVYGSCQARAGHKPFNPLLGETFECVREDRGFRYVAEQVSHHPPVSACHATSVGQPKRWTWSQDLRVKTKFWGKSMEFQPEGRVRLQLHLDGGQTRTFTWNKITTCIHNLFGGSDRWVDLYGTSTIVDDRGLSCKLDFVKASYWSNKRHELYGTVTDQNGKVAQHLFGRWSEALYCGKAPSSKCIWRPAMLPADADLYYGFSRFAMELNELLEGEKGLLPATDTRFRPDQRLLEEGRIPEAESAKLRLEQRQRERRARNEEAGGREHHPRWFAKESSGEGGERWHFTGDYWRQREDPGFAAAADQRDKLW